MSERTSFRIGTTTYFTESEDGQWRSWALSIDGCGNAIPFDDLCNAHAAALDEIEWLKAEMQRPGQSDDDGYAWFFADVDGPIEDRNVDVYHHDKCIGYAPDRASARALIERHRAMMAASPAPAKPAGLSDGARAQLISDIDGAGLLMGGLDSILRRIVERLP